MEKLREKGKLNICWLEKDQFCKYYYLLAITINIGRYLKKRKLRVKLERNEKLGQKVQFRINCSLGVKMRIIRVEDSKSENEKGREPKMRILRAKGSENKMNLHLCV